MDGGGSSEIIAGNSILNSPSDGGERAIGVAIIVVDYVPQDNDGENNDEQNGEYGA